MSIMPKKVTDIDIVFGKIGGLLPDYNDIPDEFKKFQNKWYKIASNWFYEGINKEAQVEFREGVDPSDALRHISTILGSYTPKHEHKISGVAFLLSEFFTVFEIPVKTKNEK